jgi:hypothetical protein
LRSGNIAVLILVHAGGRLPSGGGTAFAPPYSPRSRSGLALEAFLRGQEFGGWRLRGLRPRIFHSRQFSLSRRLMCPQCGEVGYGIRVGLLSGIVIRPINSGLAPRPGGDDVAYDIRDIIVAVSVNPHPRMILPPIILGQRERREEEEQASETFHVSQRH